jgi:hypothetical protein
MSIILAQIQKHREAEIESTLNAIDRICDKAKLYINDERHIWEKIRIRHMVLENLLLTGKREQVLYDIQYLWLRIYSQELAIQHLPLMGKLILLNVEIGPAFYEAFSWVDAFLMA